MPSSQRKARDEKPAAVPRAADDLLWITLEQSSGENVRFRGALVAEATSYSANVPVWHVISLYQRGASGCVSYIVSIRSHQKSVGIADSARVFRAATIEAVMDMLEGYKAEKDVFSSQSADEIKRLGPAQAALHTTKMRRDVSQVRRHYDAMVGDFLFRVGSLKRG